MIAFCDFGAAAVNVTQVGVVGAITPITSAGGIAQACANQPPDDTMTVHTVTSSGARDLARFGWDGGGGGMICLLWHGDQVAELSVTFDVTPPEAAPQADPAMRNHSHCSSRAPRWCDDDAMPILPDLC